MTYKKSHDYQLDEWVKGNSIHNYQDKVINIVDEDNNVVKTITLEGGECCPDFSCCRPDLKWPAELREKFKESNQEVREQLLMMSLNQIAKEYKDIARVVTENPNIH